MYIWIACDVSEPLGFVREECIRKNSELCLSDVAFSLPQHISLKISFPVEDAIFEDVISAISKYLGEQSGFVLDEPKPELYGTILWLNFSSDSHLLRLHKELEELLLDGFGVPLHEFDKCFKFHSTLFIDTQKELMQMYDFVCGIKMPKCVEVHRFIIGISESGKIGEYRVLREIAAIM